MSPSAALFPAIRARWSPKSTWPPMQRSATRRWLPPPCFGAIAIYDRGLHQIAPDSAIGGVRRPDARPRRASSSKPSAIRGARTASCTPPTTWRQSPINPSDVTWSLKCFIPPLVAAPDLLARSAPRVSCILSSPQRGDVWVVATSKSEMGKNGKPLVGKSYMVVTVPCTS